MNQRTKLASALLAFTLVFSMTAWSQETHQSNDKVAQESVDNGSAQAPSRNSYEHSPERYFRLTFRVLNVSPEGKVMDSHSYIEVIATGPKSLPYSSVRTRDSVPVGCATAGNPPDCPPSQFADTGTDIDVQHIEIIGQTLRLYVSANISTLSFKPPASPKYPIHRSTKWASYVIVPINKPTLIFSADNSADRGKTELELMAVPINQ
jgi:hypothetical protein